jgi:UDP-glucose:tetrahydrobiopterin glucosyltransferase
LRIALIAPLVTPIREPQRGGSQSAVADLAAGLQARGHTVHVYAATGSEIPGVTMIDTGIDAASLAGTFFRAASPGRSDDLTAEGAFSTVYAAVRDVPYHIVHNHAFDAPAIRLAAGLAVPVVHTLHLPPNVSVLAALEDVGRSERPPAVAAVSAFQAGAWRSLTRVDQVLPNGVPTARIPWSASRGFGMVFAGRLSPEKGAAEAIEIARRAGEHIDLYGDPYDLEYAQRKVYPRASEPGVAVHAAVDRAVLWEIMSRASVVLCPSRWDEPFGMVAAEAQAGGTPVVAFRRGGLQEVIADGVTGFLVTPDDIAAAAAAIRNAATSISRSACRHRAETCLDLESSLDAHEELYGRMMRSVKAKIDA